MVFCTEAEQSQPSPPCIIVHTEELVQNETSTHTGPLAVLPATEIIATKLLPPTQPGSHRCNSNNVDTGCTLGSNADSGISRSAGRSSTRAVNTIADSAVPKGFLKYWARRIGEEVAQLPDSDEFESVYAKREKVLFPFRSTTTEWTANTAGGMVVLLMPWGPLMMLLGFILGYFLGLGLAMANDVCRLRKNTSAAAQQKVFSARFILSRKIDNLMRWAGYHFASSNAQLQLVFKVIMEYEVLARLGDISRTARSQLRLLYDFLCRGDVGHCLWLYLDYFEAQYKNMTQGEISMCALTCLVCTQCAATRRPRTKPPVVERMANMMNHPNIRQVFQKAKAPNPRQARNDERTERCLFYADNSQEVQAFVMRGRYLFESLHKDCTAGRNLLNSGSDSFTDAFSESMESDASKEPLVKEDVTQSALRGELRPLENFNVAFTYGVSIERVVPCSIEGTNSSVVLPPTKHLVTTNGASPTKQQGQGNSSSGTAVKETPRDLLITTLEGRAHLSFNSESWDAIGSIMCLRAPYEFQFLDEREQHDPADTSWEQTVNQPSIQVYKYISPNSPVVIVKAYANFEGIPLAVLRHNIQEVSCRLLWSADHPSVPERPGCVRAETLMSGYLMRQCQNDPNSSTLFLVAQTDVKGLIPKWLINSTAARAPVGWVENLRRACLKCMEDRNPRSLQW
ncbi:phosphatidylcholine transfer [Cyclospora cayetanensis]|uniref:Phosphatidylcholine transfer n=1 Tax=Cyclospora cayetanensis TaxID=88456 RepID=A0A1D3D0L9_9EIME|nr:phosphatidylcholine transfer [Cyclospora cayetanensis]